MKVELLRMLYRAKIDRQIDRQTDTLSLSHTQKARPMGIEKEKKG